MTNRPDQELVGVIIYDNLNKNKDPEETNLEKMDLCQWQALITLNADLIRILRDTTGMWFHHLIDASPNDGTAEITTNGSSLLNTAFYGNTYGCSPLFLDRRVRLRYSGFGVSISRAGTYATSTFSDFICG